MKRISLFGLIGIMLLLLGVFIGCEEGVDPEAQGGYIELNFNVNGIVEANNYFFMGNNTTDSTYFRMATRIGIDTKNRNSGYLVSPLLNVGEWDCDLYELNQAYSADDPPDSTIILRSHLNIQVTLEPDETEQVTVTLTP